MKASPPYLLGLTDRLAAAAADWPAEARDAFAQFTLAHYVPGRGFCGRVGEPDVYYTAFALRTLAVLGRELGPIRQGVLTSVRHLRPRSLADLLSGLFVQRMLGDAEAVLDTAALERHRSDDGGYAQAPGGASSTYATFLAVMAYDLTGQPPSDHIAEFIQSRRRHDGGFAELAQMSAGSVNPTAAAVAVARVVRVRDSALLDGAARFLVETQRADGGWPASPRVAGSDLLSTFTALLTVSDLGALRRVNHTAAERFVRACRGEPGSFGGFPADEAADVEYTFYGVGALALMGIPV